jgi:large subunit ribosomal protein L30e
MDFNTSLRRAIKTGEVLLGSNVTKEAISDGKAQLVVVAGNCPPEIKADLSGQETVHVHTFPGTSVQLGKACGKPFMISALAVINPGESDIVSLKRA